MSTDPTNDPTTTNAPETNTMSQDDTPNTTQSFSDPTADPTADPIADPIADPGTEAAREQPSRPSSSSGPTEDPQATTTIPATPTQALPTATPFRVEPAAPVPDDAVSDTAHLPHLPPTTVSQPDPSWPAPVAAYEAPRPALVTVRKGPRPGSIMFGLLTMIVSAYILVANLTDAELSFRLVGPPMIGAFGGMLLIVGLAGVVAGRLRR